MDMYYGNGESLGKSHNHNYESHRTSKTKDTVTGRAFSLQELTPVLPNVLRAQKVESLSNCSQIMFTYYRQCGFPTGIKTYPVWDAA